MTSYPLYLLIDEYDNFANTVMMGVQRSGQGRYEALVHDEGPLRTFFKTVKSLSSGSMIERVFITGVSPVVMSDITSGYNVAKNIYFDPEFNGLCGFYEHEVEAAVKKIVENPDHEKDRNPCAGKVEETMLLMQTYYNGYTFCHGKDERIYNPTLCIYFLDHLQKSSIPPRKMLDANLAVDASKLEYIADISRGTAGQELLMDLVQNDRQISVFDIEDRFGIAEMLDDRSQDQIFLLSFLYYFGVLTIAGETESLEIILKVPNLVMKSLYVDRIKKMLLPLPQDRDEGRMAAEKVFMKGEMALLCQFMEKTYFKVFHNRDYRWANELTVKTAFLSLLYNDIIYIMDSETHINRRYADLTMIIRPDKRHAKLFSETCLLQ